MFEHFFKTVIRSIKLDKSLYKDPNTFGELSLYYAGLIMLLDGVAGAMALGTFYKSNVFLSGITSLMSWFVWAILIYVVGVKLFPEEDTSTSFKKILVTVGLAHAAGLFRFFVFLPSLVVPIVFFTQFWIFAALIVGIKEVLNFKSNFKSAGVILIVFLVISIVSLSFVMDRINTISVN
tara:strand:- start:41 stop:577 length:537 start_codon:yes stop_codon:yes gene_type:complete